MVPTETAGWGRLTTRTNQLFISRLTFMLTLMDTHSQLGVSLQPNVQDLELQEGEDVMKNLRLQYPSLHSHDTDFLLIQLMRNKNEIP